jgi:hypothetical protein
MSFGPHDGAVQMWDLCSGKPLARFVAEGYLGGAHVSPDDMTLLAFGVGEPLVLYLEEKSPRTNNGR